MRSRIELLVMPMFGGCIEEEEEVSKLIGQKRVRNICQRSWRKSKHVHSCGKERKFLQQEEVVSLVKGC